MKKLFLAAVLGLSTTADAHTVEHLIRQFYPQYSARNHCYRVEDKEQGSYCVTLQKSETRTTSQGTFMYLAFGGNHFSFSENQEDGSHANTGLVGIFVLKQSSANDWQLQAALPKSFVGAFGQAPQAWTLHEFGPGKWGFLTTHSDMHQGFSGSHFVIFAHDGGKKILTSWLGKTFGNTGAYGDHCEVMETPAERKQCLAKLTELDSTIKIQRDKPAENGFYPLQLSVSGFQGHRRFHHQDFTVRYDPRTRQYQPPRNYPLKDTDY